MSATCDLTFLLLPMITIDTRKKQIYADNMKYLYQDDNANIDLKPEVKDSKNLKIQDVWNCSDATELGQFDLKSASAVFAAFQNKPEDKFEMEWNPSIWQTQLQEKIGIDSTINSRKITWIYDYIGNKGKNYMAKYMMNEYQQHYYSVDKDVGSKDFQTIIYNYN